MHFRWWNSFNLLAVILLAIGIVGGIQGPKMIFDPGRTPTGKEWIIYLVAGGLMLINGFLPPSNAGQHRDDAADKAAKAGETPTTTVAAD
jgi:hypothetical protein